LLVESGLSELEALRCATTQSATSLGLENLGQIKEGFIADLLILNDNPLHDIENTLSINRIIKGGTVYEQQEILDLVPTDEEVQTLMEQFINEFQDGYFKDSHIEQE
jgi:adenine deaminase